MARPRQIAGQRYNARARAYLRTGAGAWTPLSLGSALLAWWDSAYGISLSGNQVTAWADRKNGHSAVQALSASRPILDPTSFNGAPGLTFDGTDDELTCTDAALLASLPGANAPSEMWAVVQQDALPADTSSRFAFSYGNGGSFCRRIGRFVSGEGVNRSVGLIGNGATGISANNNNIDFSSRHAVRVQVGATSSTITTDGNVGSTSAVVPASTVSRVRIGAGDAASAGNYWKGQGRHYLLTLPLSTEQAALMQAWVNSQRML